MNQDKRDKVIELYKKEREYEESQFGDYSENKALNMASFLIFIKHYVDTALKKYTKDWTNEIPDWLESCNEMDIQGTAPVKSYEEVIKIMALAGSILETYTDLNPEKWREK